MNMRFHSEHATFGKVKKISLYCGITKTILACLYIVSVGSTSGTSDEDGDSDDDDDDNLFTGSAGETSTGYKARLTK